VLVREERFPCEKFKKKGKVRTRLGGPYKTNEPAAVEGRTRSFSPERQVQTGKTEREGG